MILISDLQPSSKSRTVQGVPGHFIQQMDEEKYELLLLSSQQGELHLARLLSHLFSNQYLYANAKFRSMMEEDRKGFVSAKEVLRHPVIEQYFQQIGLQHPQHELVFLKATLRSLCPHLHYSEGRIRRLQPWQVSVNKPIALSSIRQQLSISDIRDYFGDDSFTPNCKPNSFVNYALVYGEEAREKASELQGNYEIPFKTHSYTQLCQDKARNTRINFNSSEKVYKPCTYPSVFPLNRQIIAREHQLRRQRHNQLNHLEETFFSLEAGQLNGLKHHLLPPNAPQQIIQPHIDEATFNSIVCSPNPSFNELLQGFIQTSCSQ